MEEWRALVLNEALLRSEAIITAVVIMVPRDLEIQQGGSNVVQS